MDHISPKLVSTSLFQRHAVPIEFGWHPHVHPRRVGLATLAVVVAVVVFVET
jgi:hypothetical protein